jgi:hypothetical protein|tara:strand:- start:1919 stop:2419 length:501 start_codon:yes stop_codon:yes gene_type:complete
MKVIKNFLPQNYFDDLKKLILFPDFTWYKREGMTPNSNIDLGYFTHSFYTRFQATSNMYTKFIIPILDQLNASSVIDVRANMFPSVFYKKQKAEFHVDCTFKNFKTAILYINNCDGGTELFINKKVKFTKAEENKILIFDGDVPHRGTVSKKTDFRYIINFNYYEK